MVSYENMADTSLTPEALVGLVLAAGPAPLLPAQLWPLQAALEQLEADAPGEGAVARVLARMPKSASGPAPGFSSVRPVVHALARRGLLTAVGCGWEAGYRIDPGWVEHSGLLLQRLSDDEARAVRKAAQRFVAMATMASKKPAASRPVMSATI